MQIVCGEHTPPRQGPDHIASIIANFAYTNAHAHTGELPLGQDMGGGILLDTAKQLGRLVTRTQRNFLQTWAQEWAQTGGMVEEISGTASPTRARATMVGPDLGSKGRGLYAPTLQCDIWYTSPKQPHSVGFSFNFIDGATRSRSSTNHLAFFILSDRLARMRLGATLSKDELALGALSAHVSRVFQAAQDPLKAALPALYRARVMDPTQPALRLLRRTYCLFDN